LDAPLALNQEIISSSFERSTEAHGVGGPIIKTGGNDLTKMQGSTRCDYSRYDLAIAIVFGIAIAALLVFYAVLLAWYGHDRTAT